MEENFIPSIYNYCDRWCEKCTFTSRCRIYESETELTPEEKDPDHEACWEIVESNFQNTIVMLKVMATEQGIDLDAVSPEEEKDYLKKQAEREEKISNHEMIRLCHDYWLICKNYFGEPANQTNEVKALVKQVVLGIKSREEGLSLATEIGENMEIIEWYMLFIDVKLQRALNGKLQVINEDAEEELYDSNGSAKIAIIAIDKSMAAWQKLYELRDTAEDVALKCLSILTTIRKKALEEFPKAMEFVRPGFDDCAPAFR